MLFIPLMVTLNFQHLYSGLQCHMFLQKSFLCADLLFKKHFFLSMLKPVFMVEAMMHFFMILC